MRANYATSERLILAHEGGYVNNPKDPGGPTNKGVTQKVYDAWRTNRGLKVQSVRLIADGEVAAIYEAQYWDQVHGDDLPPGLDYAAFDYGINSGSNRAVEDLQRTVGAPVDGKMAQMTIAAVQAAYKRDPQGVIQAYGDRRLAFMKTLKQWGTFKTGWSRRVDEVDFNAKAMAAAASAPPVLVPPQTPAPGSALPEEAPTQTLAQPAPAVITPAPIGAYRDEAGPGKALPTQQLAHRTLAGLGSILAGLGGFGAIGQQALDAVDSVKSHIDDSPFGKLALIGTVLLILAGGGLVVAAKWKSLREAQGKEAGAEA